VGFGTNFQPPLEITDGKVLEVVGPFDYRGCRWISVRIVQIDQNGVGAVAGATRENPTVENDPNDQSKQRWRLNLVTQGEFVVGRASASAVAVVDERGADIVVEWSRDVPLALAPAIQSP
jgi:hypothetical protein